MTNEPIFIVGVQRSGTTLLAAMLAAHSRLSCGPETHFFRWLSRVDRGKILDQQTWPRYATEFICSIDHKSYSSSDNVTLVEKYHINPEEIEAYLERQDPSIANILASVTEQHMITMGKKRWVEKTPDHIEHVNTIRQLFPKSPIIRIIRDPRDVALSLLKVPWGTQSFLEGLIYWRHIDEESMRFFADDLVSYTVRFEDLIAEPRIELKKLCEFIGESFEENTLDTSVTGKLINSRDVPWKEKTSQPIDISRISVWRSELSEEDNRLAEAFIGDRLAAYGYPCSSDFSQLGCFVPPTQSLVLKHAHALKYLPSEVRFWEKEPGEYRSVKVFLGDPGDGEWLEGSKTTKFINALVVSLDIILSILKGQKIFWISDIDENKWKGMLAFLIKTLLHSHKVTWTVNAPEISSIAQ